MIILGIDTSCDDTSIALVEIKKKKCKVFSNIVSSQAKLHAKYGGVYPFLAKREHKRNLPILFEKARRNMNISDIDIIGLTIGPGLEPCLWEGINFAKNLSRKHQIPIVPINHIEAHILVNFIDFFDSFSEIRRLFPAVCLIVSGGHTQMRLMTEIGKYKILGETRDDAAGECLDKVARILGLDYPGGPLIAQLAKRKPQKDKLFNVQLNLPRPMIYQKNYDFSFSGLKTAVLYDFRSRSPKIRRSNVYIQKVCFEVEQAIIDVLIKKVVRAVEEFKAKSIILGGGVTANRKLRKQFRKESKKLQVKLLVPKESLCTDNALMVAVSAFYYKDNSTLNLDKIKAQADLSL